MVFASVDPAIKEKVIAAYLAGHGRNQITRELHDQKIKVSHGSISNIINAYKRQHEQKQWKSDVSTNTNVPLNNIGSPSSMANGNGLASVTPIQEIDFADEPYDVLADPDADYDEKYDGVQGELRLNQYTNTMNPYPNIAISNANQLSRSIETKEEGLENSSSLGLGIDWDSDKNHQARFVKWVMFEKRCRQESERKLQEQWGILSIERNNLEEQKRTFEVRESKYLEVKDLIPSAAELKSMGVDFTLINAFINVIKEYASKKMIDERAATWNLAEDLKNWLELEGFEKAISNAKNQLALLDMALEGQKQAIAIVADLKKSGMTTEDISNLVKTVSRWSDQSQGQGNGGEFELDTHINLPEGWGDAKN